MRVRYKFAICCLMLCGIIKLSDRFNYAMLPCTEIAIPEAKVLSVNNIESDVFQTYTNSTSDFSTLCDNLEAFDISLRHSYVQDNQTLDDIIAETYYDNRTKVAYCYTEKPNNTVETWIDLNDNAMYSNCNATGWTEIVPLVSDCSVQTRCNSYTYNKTNISTIQEILSHCTEEYLIKAFKEDDTCTLQFYFDDVADNCKNAMITVVLDVSGHCPFISICNVRMDWKGNDQGIEQEIYSYVIRKNYGFKGIIPKYIKENCVPNENYIEAFI